MPVWLLPFVKALASAAASKAASNAMSGPQMSQPGQTPGLQPESMDFMQMLQKSKESDLPKLHLQSFY